MTTPAERAHVHVLESHELPVRTHAARAPVFEGSGRCGWRPSQDTHELHKRVMELVAKGLKDHVIAELVGVSRTAVGRHRRNQIKGCQSAC